MRNERAPAARRAGLAGADVRASTRAGPARSAGPRAQARPRRPSRRQGATAHARRACRARSCGGGGAARLPLRLQRLEQLAGGIHRRLRLLRRRLQQRAQVCGPQARALCMPARDALGAIGRDAATRQLRYIPETPSLACGASAALFEGAAVRDCQLLGRPASCMHAPARACRKRPMACTLACQSGRACRQPC